MGGLVGSAGPTQLPASESLESWAGDVLLALRWVCWGSTANQTDGDTVRTALKGSHVWSGQNVSDDSRGFSWTLKSEWKFTKQGAEVACG